MDTPEMNSKTKSPPERDSATYQIKRPIQDPANMTKEMAKGIWSFSGGTRTSGMNAIIQMTSPMKSLVRRWELSLK
jgi:hypothetical protein